MSSAKLDAFMAEMTATLGVLTPELEGLEDYGRLNLGSETRVAIDQAIVQYLQRRSVLEKAITAVTALAADGYPDLPVREVSASIKADLDAQASTIEAARAKFRVQNEAVSGEIKFGDVVPQ